MAGGGESGMDACRAGEQAPAGTTLLPKPVHKPPVCRCHHPSVVTRTKRKAAFPRPFHATCTARYSFAIAGLSSGASSSLSPRDRKSAGSGKSVSVRVDFGGRSLLQKKNKQNMYNNLTHL